MTIGGEEEYMTALVVSVIESKKLNKNAKSAPFFFSFTAVITDA
jgi:hypothetical protein